MNWSLKWYFFDDLWCLGYGNKTHLIKRLAELARTDERALNEILNSSSNNGQEPGLIGEIRSIINEASKTDVKRSFYPWGENEWPIDLQLRDVQDEELKNDIILTPDSVIMHWPLSTTNPLLETEMMVLQAAEGVQAERFDFDSSKHIRIYSVLSVLDRLIKEDDEAAQFTRNVLSTSANKEERRMAVIAYSEHLKEMGAQPFDDGNVRTFALPDSIDIVAYENMGSNQTNVSRLSDESFRIDLGLRYVTLSNAGAEYEPIGCGPWGSVKEIRPEEIKDYLLMLS